MSCHTWAYRKVADNELDKVKDNIRKKLSGHYTCVPEGKTIEEHVNDIYEKTSKAYGKDKPYTKDKLYEKIKNGNERIVSALEKLSQCNSVQSLVKSYKDYLDFDVTYKVVNGFLYVNCGFDVPCRVYGFPKETFTDCEEFIKWLKDYESDGKAKCETYRQGILFQGCDTAMEMEIRNFWAKYNNDVYIEFG